MAKSKLDCTLEDYPDHEPPHGWPKKGKAPPPNEERVVRETLGIVEDWAREWQAWASKLAVRVCELEKQVDLLLTDAHQAKLEGSGPIIGNSTSPPPPPFKGGGRK